MPMINQTSRMDIPPSPPLSYRHCGGNTVRVCRLDRPSPGTPFLTRELSLASPSYNSHELKLDSSLESVASGVAMGGGVWWEWPLFVFPDSS